MSCASRKLDILERASKNCKQAEAILQEVRELLVMAQKAVPQAVEVWRAAAIAWLVSGEPECPHTKKGKRLSPAKPLELVKRLSSATWQELAKRIRETP